MKLMQAGNFGFTTEIVQIGPANKYFLLIQPPPLNHKHNPEGSADRALGFLVARTWVRSWVGGYQPPVQIAVASGPKEV